MDKSVDIKTRDLLGLYAFLVVLLMATGVALNKYTTLQQDYSNLHNRLETLQVLVNNLHGKNGG